MTSKPWSKDWSVAGNPKPDYDLLPLVQADVEIKRSGGWYIGPCPFCGGVDRFNLRETAEGWKWFCRQCGDGRYHDAADYLMRRENITYPEALERMQGGASSLSSMEKRVHEIAQASQEHHPPETWRKSAMMLVHECIARLWHPVGAKALDYLHGRGLNDEMLKRYKIGYNPIDRTEKLEAWGLDGDGVLRIERGITIPCIGGDGAYSIKIRRPIPAGSKDRKYVQVRGGRLGLFAWTSLRGSNLVVMTEGEFDCMILDQCAGDFASVCTLGGAEASPLSIAPELMRWYYQANHVLACYDNDDPGRKGAAALQEKLPNVRIITLPDEYHDINDAHLAGLDLGGWLVRECERLGIGG